MPPGKISREYLDKIGKEVGSRPLPKDHPYHREGLTITFINRAPKRQKKEEIPLDTESQQGRPDSEKG